MDRYNAPRNDWAGLGTQPSSWSNLATDPLSAGSSSWAANTYGPFTYGRQSSGATYDPTYGGYTGYDPISGYTTQMIRYGVEEWLQREFPEYFNWESGTINTGSSGFGGNVSRNPSFGQFNKDPRVYDEIEAAASKYGVPANVVKVVLAREGSGDWSGNNTRATYLPDRNTYIVGYSGITQPAAEAWGYNFQDLVGNRALQIDAVANGLSRLWQQYGPQWGWEGVFSVYYSGKPDQSYTPADSWQYGSTASYVRDLMGWLEQENAWTTQNGGQVGTAGQVGLSTPQSPAWAPVNKWDAQVANASAKYGVPANLVKAIIRMESGGDPNARHPGGATGLMQIMPAIWNNGNSQQLLDPNYNIDLGTKILRQNYDQWGGWDAAAKAYLAGNPNSTAVDANGTGVAAYWEKVSRYWGELDAAASGIYNGPASQNPGPMLQVEAIWGGKGPFTISQEHGPGAFASANPRWYEYSIPLLGQLGHPGIDVAMPEGTQMFTPVGGTVEIAGPEYGYRIGREMDVYTPKTGQLMIRLDNGHQLILGHLNGIYVNVDDRVNPGQLVGVSGSAGTGAHLHLEYRVPMPENEWAGGWKAVDPRSALAGIYTGGLSGTTNQAGITRPFTYDEILMNAAQGKPVDYGMTTGGVNSWNTWMQAAMRGEIPNVPASVQTPTGQSGYNSGQTARQAANWIGNVGRINSNPWAIYNMGR